MHEIVLKPWGKEEWIEVNDRYVVKRITLNKGCRSSLQYHEKKQETLYLLEGQMDLLYGVNEDALSVKKMYPGDFITLNPNTIHRTHAQEDCVFLEASTIDLDDVVRIEDDYKRV